MVDPWEKVTNPTDIRNFYQSVHDYQSQTTCGASGKAACKVNIYEWGQGTLGGLDVSGVTPTANIIDQAHLDYINAGAGEGVVAALQPLLNMQYYGIGPQSFFALTEYKNGGMNGLTTKLWGNVIDMGGATNNVRPTFLGVQLANQSIIGPMYSCPITNNLTYDFAGSMNGNEVTIPSSSNPTPIETPTMNNVPYLYAFCFENGTKRSLVLINTDLSSSHTISFAGTNPPYGEVTQRQFAPAALDDMNEAPTGTATNLTPATVATETSSLSTPASIILPPYSVTALDYTAQGLAAAAMPAFSPAAGTYSASQSVTISDATAGATIYYTANGATPTTSSSVYSGPITVSTSETLEAIAVATGYANSPAAVAAYTIAPLLPATTFSPAAGTYATTQAVTISDATAGATIYYTTNGTTPTTSSSVYSGPITVNATETVEAIAVEAGYTSSAAATAAYTIAAALPAPVFSPAAGTYTGPQSVTITDATAGTNIYYTTDGSTPTTSSTMYMGAIWQSTTQTLKAIAVKTGSTNSAVTTAAYTIAPVLPTPTFSLAGGSAAYPTPQTVSISDSQSGISIYYTTNGATPTAASTLYTGPITISVTETIEAIAIETGYTNSAVSSVLYTIAPSVPAPTFSPTAGTYTTAQSVTIGDSMTGATIYYTTNGATPTTSSTKYTGAITVSATETLKAIAIETGYNNSPVVTAAYAINPVLPTPVFSVASGTYTSTQTVSISDATAGTTIYYTTNGTTPTTASTKYTGPVTVSATETLEAIAAETGYTNSATATAAYTINPALPAPVFTPAAGTYTGPQSVTIIDATAGANIYYTTDGSSPTTSSAMYMGAIWQSKTQTLKAIAVKAGSVTSAVTTAAYTIAPVLPTPTFSLAGGSAAYSGPQTFTISDSTASATIYYTTNGAAPTTSSTKYTGPITVSVTETVNAIATETGYTNSAVASVVYTIAPAASVPVFSPATGTYTTSQTVSISDATVGTTIYYTTNGTTPTTASAKYTGPVTVSATETLEAIAVETGYTNSAAATAAYTITGSASAGVNEDFSLTASGTSATVQPGGLVAYNLTATPLAPAVTFSDSVSLSASGLPAGATYSFSPASIAKSAGAAAVVLKVQLPQTALAAHPAGSIGGELASQTGPLALGLLLLPFAGRLRRTAKRLGRAAPVLLLAATVATVTGLGGCGSSNNFSAPLQQSYTVTVTGTSGTISHFTTVTLTVM
jgi:hypothetical protein